MHFFSSHLDGQEHHKRNTSKSLRFKVTESLTFEEAILAVNNVYSFLLVARGAIHFAVVLIEPAIGAAHGHKCGVAFILAHTLSLTRLRCHHTLASPATELPSTGSSICLMGH